MIIEVGILIKSHARESVYNVKYLSVCVQSNIFTLFVT